MRVYFINGRRVDAEQYAAEVSDLLARGRCLHAEDCTHQTRVTPPGSTVTGGDR